MKRFATLSLALVTFGLSQSLGAAEPIVTDSQIVSVSLFRSGARITRTAQFKAPSGKSVVRFENLPSAVDATALQASLRDARGVVRNARIFQPEVVEESAAIKALRETLEEHLRASRSIEENKKIAQDRIQFVVKMSESFAKGYGSLSDSGGSLSVTQGLQTWELVDRTRREALQTIEEVDATLRQRADAEQSLRQKLREAVEGFAQLRSVAEVEIDLDAAQTVSLELSYQALNARWEPRYELRAAPDKGTLEFGYFASIAQNTGESWTEVALSLLTNQANRSGNVPELQPLRLERNDNAPFSKYKSGLDATLIMQSRSGGFADKASPTPPSEQQIAVSSNTTSFQVLLPGAATVPSFKDAALLPVTSKSFKAEYWSEAVPRVELAAYLRAKAKNELELPILPGLALAFVDGTLSSKVSLDKTLPGEDLELSFGTDAKLVVTRVEGAQEDKQTGFIDKTVTLHRTFTNTIASYHAVPHKIVVVDQFPIATDAKIEIARLAPKSADILIKEEEKDSGIFRWEAMIAPMQSKSFKIEYTVVHPRDWTVYPEL